MFVLLFHRAEGFHQCLLTSFNFCWSLTDTVSAGFYHGDVCVCKHCKDCRGKANFNLSTLMYGSCLEYHGGRTAIFQGPLLRTTLLSAQ